MRCPAMDVQIFMLEDTRNRSRHGVDALFWLHRRNRVIDRQSDLFAINQDVVDGFALHEWDRSEGARGVRRRHLGKHIARACESQEQNLREVDCKRRSLREIEERGRLAGIYFLQSNLYLGCDCVCKFWSEISYPIWFEDERGLRVVLRVSRKTGGQQNKEPKNQRTPRKNFHDNLPVAI